MTYCVSCGAELEVGVKFCQSCGVSVKTNPEVDYPNNLESYKKANKIDDLDKIITNFCNSYSAEKSENIYFLDEIQEEFIKKHKNIYLNLDPDEKVLVLLNKAAMFGNVFSGLVITNKKIHYRLVKKSYFASIALWLAKPRGNKTIIGLDSIEIAEHDTCFGTAYVGHELRINNEILGYLRMGRGILADEKALIFLNALFDNLSENNIIKRKVNKYKWQ